jgi:CheY-like chemotaxis protein
MQRVNVVTVQLQRRTGDFQSDISTMAPSSNGEALATLPAAVFEAERNLMDTKVLVVEDDLEINELVGEYLALENITYVQATTGQGGIHQAVTQHPDAMILDLMLPDIDGFEVAKSLTTKRATFDIPIVILSCMCQADDKQKGFASGALFYMNKPFLPDDLLATLRKALEWKRGLLSRVPEGSIVLGGGGSCPSEMMCTKGINQMVADIFARTDLTDPVVAQIREAIETLGRWAVEWNKEHRSNVKVTVDYKVTPAGDGLQAGLDWTVSESEPGMLTEAFFKPAPTGQSAALNGWGTGSLMVKPLAPIAPPSRWLQVLAKTGAGLFEKNSRTRTVRFARGGNAVGAVAGQVPVVEIDGNRYPTRLRGEAMAARRK